MINKKMIIAVICIIGIGFLGYTYALSFHLPGPSSNSGVIYSFDAPDYYLSEGTVNIDMQIKNNWVGHVYYVWRVRDTDITGPVSDNDGWNNGININSLFVSPNINIPLEIPGINGMGNDFNGIVEIAHYTSATDDDSIWIDDSRTFTITYNEQPNTAPTIGQISGSSNVETGEPANYYCNVYDNEGDDVQIKWDFGDSSTTSFTPVNSGTASTNHVFNNPGTFEVKAQAKDSEGNIGSWSSPKTVIVTGQTVQTIKLDIVVTGTNGQTIMDATVSLDSSNYKQTDMQGIVSYDIEPGLYNIKISKDGFGSYDEQHTISQDSTLEIQLNSEQETTGFEFLTLLSVIVVAYIILRRKRL